MTKLDQDLNGNTNCTDCWVCYDCLDCEFNVHCYAVVNSDQCAYCIDCEDLPKGSRYMYRNEQVGVDRFNQLRDEYLAAPARRKVAGL